MQKNSSPINTPIQDISRVGPQYGAKLKKLGISTVRDLFYHFPHRYEDYSLLLEPDEIVEGQTCTIIGQIKKTKITYTFRRRMAIVETWVGNENRLIKAIWFNQPYLSESLKEGQMIAISGKPVHKKTLIFQNPAHEFVRKDFDPQDPIKDLIHTGRLVPIYPETEGVSSRWLRYILRPLIPYVFNVPEFLPKGIIKAQKLLELPKALIGIHFPPNQKMLSLAKKRLAFDEILLIQLMVLLQKQSWHDQKAVAIKFDQPLVKEFVSNLPFHLTNSQRLSAWEILQDLSKNSPMNRLLEGDVGSGKTVVSAISALQAVKAGYQVAFMAPTEILAQQHYKTITHALKKYNLNIALLTASTPKKKSEREELLNDIKYGNIKILIGTHSLIQESVKFKNLSLVVIDEQHRFGVMQRASLLKQITHLEDGLNKTTPHLLSMTATPIPRTLSLTVYGSLDLSLLNEIPAGRQTIKTKIISVPKNRQATYLFIEEEVANGRQAFVVCPKIEPKTGPLKKGHLNIVEEEIKAVKSEYEKLSKQIFPKLKIGLLHGKIKAMEKEKIMQDFSDKKIDILVTTSVIEVGIDVPNATIMMIEGADRFGLAQLHQLRGRVGRGSHQSYCFLLSTSGKETARLKAVIDAKNGFELAEKDLQLRGPGQFFGTQQSGLPDLAMVSLTDSALIKNARQVASQIIAEDPQLKNHSQILERLKEFQQGLHRE